MRKILKFTIVFILFCYGLMALKTHSSPDERLIIINEDFWSLIEFSEAHCLALNIYHESRSDNLAGQYAVADVVMNRVESVRYPDTVCGVIYQARTKPSWKDPEKMIPVRNKCQFSWYCDGKDDTPHETEAWAQAQYVAYSMLHDKLYRGITEGATHYHTTYVSPTWNKSFYSVGRIGSHVFFRAD